MPQNYEGVQTQSICMPHILAIDDDRTVLLQIEKALSETGFKLTQCGTAEEGLPYIVDGEVDVCLLDIMLPEMNGIELARKIRSIDARLPMIFITSQGDSHTAIEAMSLGAYDFCTKPLHVDKVRELTHKALEARRLMRSRVVFEQANLSIAEDGDRLVGQSPQMVEVYKQIGRVASQHVPVLIRGESGTGKELIARAIYQHSHLKEECYLAVNCAALSDTLLESELFGHEKGAFTGADRRHIGKFEQCAEGTIFLDEIGDMSPLLQSKTLRLLQEQKFERVGGQQTISTNARIISATNRDLEQMIDDNEYRLDVYHRINAFEIVLPPLRERGEDLDLLVDHFIRQLAPKLGTGVEGISIEAMEMLREYPWPGNVRELQSVIRRSLLMATGPIIVPENLSIDIESELGTPHSYSDGTGGGSSDSESLDIERFVNQRISAGSNQIFAESVAMLEKRVVKRVLSETAGNQSKAAAMLGITRGSLRNKIRTHGISISQTIGEDNPSD
jgi:two-component system nitrogen regulation response regulator GlnG